MRNLYDIPSTADNVLYIIEKNEGSKENLNKNACHKELIYCPLLTDVLQLIINRYNLLISPLAVLAYLEISLTHFLSFAWKEALAMVI